MTTKSRDIHTEIPDEMWLWPLYGQGFDKLGAAGGPVRTPVPSYGPDELLVRNDAVGMCFSDIKIINLGPEHPRLVGRDMQKDPVVLGHEVTMTVVGVGENLKGKFDLGERFTIQADVVYKGDAIAYGYKLQGGMAQYGVIGPAILEGDGGNYLIPVAEKTTGYSQSALTEPWACVLASYNLKYREGLKPGGTAWFIGDGRSDGFTISSGFDGSQHPARVILSDVPAAFEELLRSRSPLEAVRFEKRDGLDPDTLRTLARELDEKVDDVVFLGAPSPEVAQIAIGTLALAGVANIVSSGPMAGKTKLDVGRVHYHDWVVVGTTETDVAAGYRHGVRSALREDGTVWFVGAAGPMGRMHVQRAIELENGPRLIVATDLSQSRLDHLEDTFREDAKERGVEFVCLNPGDLSPEDLDARFRQLNGGGGFDDIVVLVPVPAVIEGSAPHLASDGVMNIFAGVARGVKAELDLSPCYGADQVRIIGSSASSIDDLKAMLAETESGRLSTNRCVAAIGGMLSVREGYEAVANGVYPGKVVIYPQIEDYPLTPLEELSEKDPQLGERLDRGVWNVEVENALLARVPERSVSRPSAPQARGALRGKVAIISGAAQGLGRHLAERLVDEGAWITLLDINEEALGRTALEIEASCRRRVRYSRVDVTDEEAVTRAVDEVAELHGRVDVLVANAGILHAAELTCMPVEKFRKVIDVNLTGYFILAKAVARHMVKQGSGSIVQINSKSGKKGSLHNSAYASSKFGGVGLTQSLALDLAPHGVRINSVCPGNLLDSPLWKDYLFDAYAEKWGITVEEVRKKYVDQVPLKRGCAYEDVSNVVVFLASEQASYMTGQAINVTGGQEMR